jgi:hypothetical protein
MALRKWLVRGLVFAILGGLAAGALVYLRWTDPAIVRQQVIAQLESHLPGALVALDGARLRLLGGIALTELRLTRRDDHDRTDVLSVPGGIIYHDKEQLSRGKLAIRKFELHRPRFRVIRDRECRWNVQGIIGPVDLTKSIPTIVIQQGTIYFEDRSSPNLPVIEIANVNLTILNDPASTLVFRGTGVSDLVGPVQLHGTIDRASEALEATLEVSTIPVGPMLIERLGAYLPTVRSHARHLEGLGHLQARFQYRPESQQWDHDLRFGITGARLEHAEIPLPLHDLEANARIVNGRIVLERLTARAGTARLYAVGERTSFDADAELRGELKVEDLTLTPELLKRLPPSLHTVQESFSPAGRLDLVWKIEARGTRILQEGVVTPRGMTLCYRDFPYPATDVTGALDVHLGPEGHLELLRVDLTGRAGGEPVRLAGTVAGPKPAAFDLKISGQNLPLDETLLSALPERLQKLARSFHARGKVDYEGFIRREQGNAHFTNRYLARFHDMAICYDVFPYPLERVSATLEMLPGHWEVRDFAGTHQGADIRGQARSYPAEQGSQRVDIDLRGKNLLLDDELRKAVAGSAARAVKPAWDVFHPSGRADFHALIELPPDKSEPNLDVTVVARSCTIVPDFFPYTLSDLNGTLRYTAGKVELQNVTARHGPTIVRLPKAAIHLKPGGGFFAMLPELEASSLAPDADLVRALPAPLQSAVTTLQLRDPINLSTEVRVDMPAEAGKAPVVYWDGGLTVQNASLRLGMPFQRVSGRLFCRGRHNGKQLEGVVGNLKLEQAVLFNQPIRNIHGRLEVWKDTPDILRVPELSAAFFGGNLGGQARVEFGPTLRYELDLTALGVKLEQMGRHNLRDQAELSGEAVGRLYLKGEGTDLSGLAGGGSIDIPNGKLYNLPLLLDLLKFLSVRWPDRTAFEEAHARFTIQGPRVHINRLELLGNAVSLGGDGQMTLDGSDMNLDLYVVWGRIMQLLPPLIKDVPPWISRRLLKIKVRGPIHEPQFDKEPVPLLVEPVKDLLQRMTR